MSIDPYRQAEENTQDEIDNIIKKAKSTASRKMPGDLLASCQVREQMVTNALLERILFELMMKR